jgi:hypothetical protein
VAQLAQRYADDHPPRWDLTIRARLVGKGQSHSPSLQGRLRCLSSLSPPVFSRSTLPRTDHHLRPWLLRSERRRAGVPLILATASHEPLRHYSTHTYWTILLFLSSSFLSIHLWRLLHLTPRNPTSLGTSHCTARVQESFTPLWSQARPDLLPPGT